MSILQSPKIIIDGLIFYYDMINGKSFIGGPVTNTIPSPSINALPTIGNGWGTYNTNQYNNNTYFSIGAISSVSSNIITTSGNHPLRSYDVVTPQTSGGGVTAGVNYLVKKLSNTTFSLHAYNSSQDGSQGYINPATGNHKVYDDFANDVRISVNSSSFPTMWWGPPHLPNSALVKEIITNGFNGIPGRAPTDCIRLHHNRTDATDGMAYGVDAAVVSGTPYTVSFCARSVTPSAVGTTGSYQIYNYGVTTPTGYSTGYTLGPVGEWRKYTLTFTPNNPTCISYWFPGAGGIKYDIANIQFEAGSIANNFVAGSRSSTEVLKDLTGNNTITANNLTYNSNGTFSWASGVDARIQAPSSSNFSFGTGDFTLECWINPTNFSGYTHMIALPDQNTFALKANTGDGAIYFYSPSFTTYPTSGWTLVAGTWNHVVMTRASSTSYSYLNGSLKGSKTGFTNNFTAQTLNIGNGYPNEYTAKSIGSVKIYNRALSSQEVQQNFQACRSRFGI